MSKEYDKVKESTPLEVQVEVLEDLLAISNIEIQVLKRRLSQAKNNVALDGVSKSLNADELIKSLGEPTKDNEYKLISDDSGVWWLEHKYIGSGEPLKQWLTGKP